MTVEDRSITINRNKNSLGKKKKKEINQKQNFATSRDLRSTSTVNFLEIWFSAKFVLHTLMELFD